MRAVGQGRFGLSRQQSMIQRLYARVYLVSGSLPLVTLPVACRSRLLDAGGLLRGQPSGVRASPRYIRRLRFLRAHTAQCADRAANDIHGFVVEHEDLPAVVIMLQACGVISIFRIDTCLIDIDPFQHTTVSGHDPAPVVRVSPVWLPDDMAQRLCLDLFGDNTHSFNGKRKTSVRHNGQHDLF